MKKIVIPMVLIVASFLIFSLTSFAQITVPIDIKAESCPNSVNVKKNGVISVTIVGTDNFDATLVDITTVTLEGVWPIRSNVGDDVAIPYYKENDDCFDCIEYDQDEDLDGIPDVTLHFNTIDIVEAIEDITDRDCILLTLTGLLQDGTPFIGFDNILIGKKVKK